MKLIADACTIILLAKASVLESCSAVHEIQITKDVYTEVLKGKEKGFPDALLTERLCNEKKIQFCGYNKEMMNKLLKDFNMDRGEASTIASGLERRDTIATDNKQGRIAAQVQGLSLVGSPDIVLSLMHTKKITRQKALNAIRLLESEGWFSRVFIERVKEEVKNE